MVNPNIEHILTSPASRAALIICRDCRQPIGEAIDDSKLITDFNLQPLTPEQEETAWADGHTTLGLTLDGSLYRRCSQWRNGGRRALIVQEHDCGRDT